MSLEYSCDYNDFGFPGEIHQTGSFEYHDEIPIYDEDEEGNIIIVGYEPFDREYEYSFTTYPDYGDAFGDCGSTFYSVATQAVPVDTGALLASIWWSSSSEGFECGADAYYAEFVQYGTWKMSAQPFFDDAVDAGTTAAYGGLQDAYNLAQEEMFLKILQFQIDSIMLFTEEYWEEYWDINGWIL